MNGRAHARRAWERAARRWLLDCVSKWRRLPEDDYELPMEVLMEQLHTLSAVVPTRRTISRNSIAHFPSRFFVDASIESIPMRCQSYRGPLSLTGTRTPVKFHLKLKEQSPLLTRPHWRDTSFFK